MACLLRLLAATPLPSPIDAPGMPVDLEVDTMMVPMVIATAIVEAFHTMTIETANGSDVAQICVAGAGVLAFQKKVGLSDTVDATRYALPTLTVDGVSPFAFNRSSKTSAFVLTDRPRSL